MTIYVYRCNFFGCEDRQSKYCGTGYRCPFCGEGYMTVDEEYEDTDDGD